MQPKNQVLLYKNDNLGGNFLYILHKVIAAYRNRHGLKAIHIKGQHDCRSAHARPDASV